MKALRKKYPDDPLLNTPVIGMRVEEYAPTRFFIWWDLDDLSPGILVHEVFHLALSIEKHVRRVRLTYSKIEAEERMASTLQDLTDLIHQSFLLEGIDIGA